MILAHIQHKNISRCIWVSHSHLDLILWWLHADHAQVVLLAPLHVGLALLPHIPSQPHPVRMQGLGRHGRNAHWTVHLRMGPFAFSATVVGLLALSANAEVGQFAHLAAAEAVDDLRDQSRVCFRGIYTYNSILYTEWFGNMKSNSFCACSTNNQNK